MLSLSLQVDVSLSYAFLFPEIRWTVRLGYICNKSLFMILSFLWTFSPAFRLVKTVRQGISMVLKRQVCLQKQSGSKMQIQPSALMQRWEINNYLTNGSCLNCRILNWYLSRGVIIYRPLKVFKIIFIGLCFKKGKINSPPEGFVTFTT